MNRRRFLGLLGATPTLPLLAKLPASTPSPAPVVVPTTNLTFIRTVNGALIASGGYCVPFVPHYDITSVRT